MQAEYICPLCRSAIALADVNVATDLALCRSCGRTSSFSLISGASEISLETLNHPPQYIQIEKDFHNSTTVITYYKFSRILYFLVPFTAFWSGVSMWGIYGTQFSKGHFDLGQSLFGLPFLIGTIILLGVIAFLMLGKWVITLRKGEGIVFVGLGSLGWTRHFTYNRESLVSLRPTNLRVNNVPQQGILVQNDTAQFIFGSMLTDDAKHFIAAKIMKEADTVPSTTFV